MTSDNNPVDQSGYRPGQYNSTGAVPAAGEPDNAPATRDEPVYITDTADATHETAPAPAPETGREVPQEQTKVKGSVAGGTWAALIIGALLLIVLIIFILQNQQEVEITFLQWTVHFPAAIAYLLSAIAGALIMALVGGWRMVELRRQVKKARR